MRIQVYNNSQFTAEQLAVNFAAPLGLDTTNVIAPTWELQPQTKLRINDQQTDIATGNQWRWSAGKTAAGYATYDVASIAISTNSVWPVLQVKFHVFANRSKVQTFVVNLAFND